VGRLGFAELRSRQPQPGAQLTVVKSRRLHATKLEPGTDRVTDVGVVVIGSAAGVRQGLLAGASRREVRWRGGAWWQTSTGDWWWWAGG
jgi:hypothetical protein